MSVQPGGRDDYSTRRRGREDPDVAKLIASIGAVSIPIIDGLTPEQREALHTAACVLASRFRPSRVRTRSLLATVKAALFSDRPRAVANHFRSQGDRSGAILLEVLRLSPDHAHSAILQRINSSGFSRQLRRAIIPAFLQEVDVSLSPDRRLMVAIKSVVVILGDLHVYDQDVESLVRVLLQLEQTGRLGGDHVAAIEACQLILIAGDHRISDALQKMFPARLHSRALVEVFEKRGDIGCFRALIDCPRVFTPSVVAAVARCYDALVEHNNHIEIGRRDWAQLVARSADADAYVQIAVAALLIEAKQHDQAAGVLAAAVQGCPQDLKDRARQVASSLPHSSSTELL